MESHSLPFACTTNFGERLDPATLRRFTVKITLDYLSPNRQEQRFVSTSRSSLHPRLLTLLVRPLATSLW